MLTYTFHFFYMKTRYYLKTTHALSVCMHNLAAGMSLIRWLLNMRSTQCDHAITAPKLAGCYMFDKFVPFTLILLFQSTLSCVCVLTTSTNTGGIHEP